MFKAINIPKRFIFESCRLEFFYYFYFLKTNAYLNFREFLPFSFLEDTHQLHLNKIKSDPSVQDMLICYSTTPGGVSWRDEQKGDWFIHSFVEALAMYGCEHFDKLMKLVTNKLNDICNNYQVSQTPSYEKRGTTKDFYLNQGLHSTRKRKFNEIWFSEPPCKKIRV